MRFSHVILALILGLEVAPARPAQIILLRHAEKPDDPSDLHLSPEGRKRANALVQFLTTNSSLTASGLPTALFATRPTSKGHSLRPHETLEPLARCLNLEIQTPYRPEDYMALAKHILRDPAFDGKTVVICWVHSYLPELASALGVKSRPGVWESNVFDQVWLISYARKRARLTVLTQPPP